MKIRALMAVVLSAIIAIVFAGCNKDESVPALASKSTPALASKGANSPEELGAAIAKAIIELDQETLMSFVDESAKYDRALKEELEGSIAMYRMFESPDGSGEFIEYDIETARKKTREQLEKELGGSDIVYSTTVDKPGSMRFSEPGMLELLPRVKLAGDTSDGMLLTNPLICRKLGGKWVFIGKYP